MVDTPGQIEIFTWSASGAIITESFASTFPTCVLFVVAGGVCGMFARKNLLLLLLLLLRLLLLLLLLILPLRVHHVLLLSLFLIFLLMSV